MVPVKWRVCRTSLFCTIKLGKNVVFSSGNFMVVPIICITPITIDFQPLKQTFNMYFAKRNTQNEEKSILPHDNSLEVYIISQCKNEKNCHEWPYFFGYIPWCTYQDMARVFSAIRFQFKTAEKKINTENITWQLEVWNFYIIFLFGG